MNEIVNSNADITANSKQIALLKKNFPQFFDKRGAFILQKLQEFIGESDIEFSRESYSLSWLGKSYSSLLANENPRTLLAEDKKHNQKPINKVSENILIEGDNFEVLKHLVNAYSEQAKMVYIDPPYNTGADGFTYQDDRKFTVQELCTLSGVDKDEAKRILDFTQSKSNSHSAWLTYIYPRLYVAKELLKDNGVIFISIDDNEYANLKLLCDHVFGEENFIGTIVWKNVTDNNPSNIVTEHEYIICYARSKSELESEWKSQVSDVKGVLVKIGEELIEKHGDTPALRAAYKAWYKENKKFLGAMEGYKFIDGDGVYCGSRSVHNPGKEGYIYDVMWKDTEQPCKRPLMGYRFPPSTMDTLLAEKRIIFGDTPDKLIELKVYAKEYVDKLSSVIELDGRSGANELRELFPEVKTVFTNPKPTDLIEKLVSFASGDDDLIIDFFAGSGTTQHSVMKLNAETGANRRCISVQVAEPTEDKSDALKAGFKTIFDITRERIERASASLKKKFPDCKADLGFRIFKAIPVFDGYLDDIEKADVQRSLFDGSKLKPEQLEHLLTTWKVYDGMPLTKELSDITLEKSVAKYSGQILYLMEAGFTTEDLKKLIEKLDNDKSFSPAKIVLFGFNFESKNQREIKEALASFANKKSIQVDVKVRY